MDPDGVKIPDKLPPIKPVIFKQLEDGRYGFEYETEADCIGAMAAIHLKKDAPSLWERRGNVLVLYPERVT